MLSDLNGSKTKDELIVELQSRLDEAEQTLNAIQNGEIDAIITPEGSDGPKVYTLESADTIYRTLIEEMGEGVATLTDDDTIFYCNAQLALLLNVPLDKIIGLKLSDFVINEDLEKYWSIFNEGLKAKTKGEINIRSVDGTLKPVLLSINNLKDLKGVYIVMTDLTEQMHHEELKIAYEKLSNSLKELGRTESFLSAVTNLSSEVIFVKDSQSRWMYMNPALERIMGKSSDELLGKTDLEIFSDPEIGRTIIENDKRIMESGMEETIEEVVETSDGIRSFISVKTPRFNEKREIIGIVGISHDITERKQIEKDLKKSEQSLAEAQHIAHIGSWEWNLKTGEINWSNELYSIYKLDPNKFTPTLNSFAEYIHPDDEEYVNNEVDQLLSGDKSRKFDFRIVLDDGSIRVLNTLAEVAKYDENGKPSIIMGINQDITEQKKTELKLKENMKKLADSNRELEQFAYITSHDLREPLRMITSFLQLLERKYKDQLDQDANDYIGFAVDGAKRLDAMTNDLLLYSKISRNKKEITIVNVDEVLEIAKMNLKVQIDESKATITHDPLPTISGDESLLIRLLQNLIGNAIKYRSHDPPKIHISAKKEQNQYLFSIKDNGIGMSPNHVKQIFTIFKRLHTREEYEGTGIGLAISQKIVLQHGGEIWAKSELGKGSTFYFTIPINRNSIRQIL